MRGTDCLRQWEQLIVCNNEGNGEINKNFKKMKDIKSKKKREDKKHAYKHEESLLVMYGVIYTPSLKNQKKLCRKVILHIFEENKIVSNKI